MVPHYLTDLSILQNSTPEIKKSDDLLLDLDETHAQVIRDANSTENGADCSVDELERKLDKMSDAIAEMEAAEMASACQVYSGLNIFLKFYFLRIIFNPKSKDTMS